MNNQIDKLKLMANTINNLKNYNLDLENNYLFNIILQNINTVITEYYYLDIFKFDNLKNKIIDDIILVRNNIKYKDENYKIINDINNIIYLSESLYFPVYLNYNKYYKKIKKIEFFHKPNSLEIINNFNDDLDEYIKFDKNLDDNNIKDDIEYNNKERNLIKNKSIFVNKILKKKMNSDETKYTFRDIEEFLGKNNKFPNSKLCTYCENYVHIKYYISKSKNNNIQLLDYCIHCWAWLNFNDVNLQDGLYFGNLEQNTVFDSIINASEIHKKINCNINSCIFYQFEKLKKNNKLNIIFCEKTKKNLKNKQYNIKSKNFKINWSKSYIII
jgi:hypothetical protein